MTDPRLVEAFRLWRAVYFDRQEWDFIGVRAAFLNEEMDILAKADQADILAALREALGDDK